MYWSARGSTGCRFCGARAVPIGDGLPCKLRPEWTHWTGSWRGTVRWGLPASDRGLVDETHPRTAMVCTFTREPETRRPRTGRGLLYVAWEAPVGAGSGWGIVGEDGRKGRCRKVSRLKAHSCFRDTHFVQFRSLQFWRAAQIVGLNKKCLVWRLFPIRMLFD